MSISGNKRQRADPVEMGEDLQTLRYIPSDDERLMLSEITATGYIKPSQLVSAITQALSPVLESIQTIAEAVEELSTTVSELSTTVQELSDTVGQLETGITDEDKEDLINNLKDVYDVSIGAVEAQTAANTASITVAQAGIAGLQSELSALASAGFAVDAMQSLFDIFGTTTLGSIISSLKSDVTSLETDVSTIQETYTKTETLNGLLLSYSTTTQSQETLTTTLQQYVKASELTETLTLYQTLEQQEQFQQSLPSQYVQVYELGDIQTSLEEIQASIPSLEGYATSAWVTEQIAEIPEPPTVDLTPYALQADLQTLQTQVTAVTATIPSLEDYATSAWVTQQIEAIPDPPAIDLTPYALQTWVTQQIALAATSGTVDLSSYALQANLQTQIDRINALQQQVNSLPTTQVNLDPYATTNWVTQQLLNASLTASAYTEVEQLVNSSLVTPKADITALQTQTASIQTQVSALPTATYVNNQVNNFVSTATFQNSVDTRITQKTNPEIQRLEGMIGNISTSNQNLSVSYDALYTLVQSINPVTQSDVEALFLTFSQNYTTTTNLNTLLGGYTPIGQFTALSDNLPVQYATKSYVTQQISNSNASDATQSWVTDQLANYSTTTQMNTAISNATAPLATSAQLASYSTTAQMNTAITNATSPLATTSQLANYATTVALQSAQTSLTSYSNNKILLGWCYIGDPGSSTANNNAAATFAGYTLGQFGGALTGCTMTSNNVSDQQQCYTVVNITWSTPADTPANSRYHPVFVVGDLAYPTTDDGRATNYLSIPIVKKSLTATGCTFQIRDQFGASTQSFQNGNALVYVMLVRRDNVM